MKQKRKIEENKKKMKFHFTTSIFFVSLLCMVAVLGQGLSVRQSLQAECIAGEGLQ